MLIFPLEDLSQVAAGKLHLISDDQEISRLFGQLWRNVGAAGGARDLIERPSLPCFVTRQWNASRLAAAVTADLSPASDFGRPLSRYASELGLVERDCDNSGPTYKIIRVSDWGRFG